MSFKSVSFNSRDIAVQKGLSLVELLVALALSAILILGIFTVYMESSQTSRLSTSLARVQESARIGLDILARDLRMVGFQGCADPDDVTLNVIADNPPTAGFLTPLRAWEVTDANWADGTEFDGTTIESSARVGSDVIAIQRGEMVSVEVTGKMKDGNANIKVAGDDVIQFSKSELVLISDCESADLFRISSKPASGTWAHAKGVNSANRLSQAYNEKARIMKFSSTIYYVADTGRDDVLGGDIYALFRATASLSNPPVYQPVELVEGVESLQLEFGEKLASNNFRYATADDAVLNMTGVVAARAGLLVSDAERVRDDDDLASYDLPGELITPTSGAGAVKHPEDRRLRKIFIETVTLRNRD